MKKIYIILLAILIVSGCGKKQKPPQSDSKVISSSVDLSNTLRKWNEVSVSSAKTSELKSNDSLYYSLPIGETTVMLVLKKVDINPTVTMSDGSKYVSSNNTIHYQGTILGRNGSKVAITMSNGEPNGYATDPVWGNTIIGKIEDGRNISPTIVYNDSDLIGKPTMPEDDQLQVPDEEKIKLEMQKQISKSAAVNKCVQIHWEIDNDIYLAKGAGTVDFIQGLFNQVLAYNSISNIPIKLKSMKVWNTVDPFVGPNTFDFLNQWYSYKASNPFNADLGLLVGTKGSGGVAYVTALSTSYNIGYAGISLSYNTVPVYSWSVMVCAHEQGHIMGSQHTMSCAWNNNNTAIDGCYPTEGGCPRPPNPVGGGTCMSYCHLVSGIGINMALGFGPQPAERILQTIANAPTLTACDTITPPNDSCATIRVTPSISISGTINVPPNTTVTITSNPVNGGNNKRIDWYKNNVLDTAHSLTYIFIPVNGNTIRAQLYNPDSCVTSHFANSTTLTFTVTPPPSGCNVPGGLATTSITSTGAKLTWGAVVNAPSYKVWYRKKVGGSWTEKNTANLFTTVTSLTSNTEYEWKVLASCTPPSAFSPLSFFTTLSVEVCPFFAALDLTTNTSVNVTTGVVSREFTFHAKAFNGTNYQYQFFRTGVVNPLQSGTSTQYTILNPVVGHEYYAIITSGRTCSSPKTITTNKIKVQ